MAAWHRHLVVEVLNNLEVSKKTTDFLDKSTWALATLLLVLILLSNVAIGNSDTNQESKALDPNNATSAPAPEAPVEDIPITNDTE